MKSGSRRLLLFLALSAAAGASQAITYTTGLSGPNEFPPVASPGTGFATVNYDALAHTLRVNATFSGLLGNTTVSHIHCCVVTPGAGTAGVATQLPSFAGFPQGVTSGTYDNTFSTLAPATWNAAFITANGGTVNTAEAALAAGLSSGSSYFNIHSTAFPGGEIRGFLIQAANGVVPEPPGIALFAIAAALLVTIRRRHIS